MLNHFTLSLNLQMSVHTMAQSMTESAHAQLEVVDVVRDNVKLHHRVR